MGAYINPLFQMISDLCSIPKDLRLQQETELRTRLYEQCIQEGRDPYQDPKLMSPDYIAAEIKRTQRKALFRFFPFRRR